MNRTAMLTATLTLVAILVTGCAAREGNIRRYGPQDEKEYSYEITVSKSEVNRDTIQVLYLEKKILLKTLMDEAGLVYSTETQNGNQVLSELDGVIGTVGMQWNLYVNNIKQTDALIEGTLIKPTDTVRWKYEKTGEKVPTIYTIEIEQ